MAKHQVNKQENLPKRNETSDEIFASARFLEQHLVIYDIQSFGHIYST
jgi:hypothetical protein